MCRGRRGGGRRCKHIDVAFHSDHVTAIVTATTTYAWRGRNAPEAEVTALQQQLLVLRADPARARMARLRADRVVRARRRT